MCYQDGFVLASGRRLVIDAGLVLAQFFPTQYLCSDIAISSLGAHHSYPVPVGLALNSPQPSQDDALTSLEHG